MFTIRTIYILGAIPLCLALTQDARKGGAPESAQSKAAKAKKTVVALPLRFSKQQFDLEGARVAAADFARLLGQRMNNVLSEAGVWNVLDRDYLVQIIGEQDLIRSSDTDPSEQLKLGKRLGADLMIVGTIEDVEAGASTRTVELTGTKVTTRRASAVIDYRLIHVPTSRIDKSTTLRMHLDDNELAKLGARLPGARLDDALADEAARRLIVQILDAAAPMRVAKIDGKLLQLKDVAGRAREGDLFIVSAPVVFEPSPSETGESSAATGGYAVREVATIRITKVEGAAAEAAVVDGDAALIKIGSKCKRKE